MRKAMITVTGQIDSGGRKSFRVLADQENRTHIASQHLVPLLEGDTGSLKSTLRARAFVQPHDLGDCVDQ
jgi:hypothetical protein